MKIINQKINKIVTIVKKKLNSKYEQELCQILYNDQGTGHIFVRFSLESTSCSSKIRKEHIKLTRVALKRRLSILMRKLFGVNHEDEG